MTPILDIFHKPLFLPSTFEFIIKDPILGEYNKYLYAKTLVSFIKDTCYFPFTVVNLFAERGKCINSVSLVKIWISLVFNNRELVGGRRAAKMIKQLERMSYGNKLTWLNLCSLAK